MARGSDKQPLLGGGRPAPPSRSHVGLVLLLLAAIALLATQPTLLPEWPFDAPSANLKSLCPQADARAPSSDAQLDSHRQAIFSVKYRNESAGILGGFVRVKSESFDDEGEGDTRWDVFYRVTNYLKKTFPLLHEHLSLEKINEHGHLYTWQGSDASLKPIVLMGHLDTVPVNPATVDQWTYEPWSGHFDGEYLWGRGASDDKNAVSAVFEAITFLLEGDFKPRRTVLLSFGFDEESRGWGGAGHLAKAIEERYGKDGVAFLVDEGGMGVGESSFGFPLALPAVTEKGYLNANFTLHIPGGHSSVPPAHSGIGIISQIVNELEMHPFTPSLPLWSPQYSVLQCVAKHGNLSSSLKRNVELGNSDSHRANRAREHLAKDYAALGAFERFTVTTSQAVDIISGGVKVNALPELVNVVVNYRVDVSSSTQEVKQRIVELVKPLARRFNLELDAFGHSYSSESTAGGKLVVEATVEHPAAPLSSTTDNPVWDTFAGTIKHAFGHRFPDQDLVVSPALMLGNTDVRWYTNVTPNRYRWTPMDRSKSSGQHTVDERLWFDDHINGVYFFHELVRNAGEADFA
ncbi:hypothetical protein JCM10207_001158 [Rhodosporidiobolus poonsookiae]